MSEDEIFAGGGTIIAWIEKKPQPPRVFINGEEVMEQAYRANTQDNYTQVKTSDLLVKLKTNETTREMRRVLISHDKARREISFVFTSRKG